MSSGDPSSSGQSHPSAAAGTPLAGGSRSTQSMDMMDGSAESLTDSRASGASGGRADGTLYGGPDGVVDGTPDGSGPDGGDAHHAGPLAQPNESRADAAAGTADGTAPSKGRLLMSEVERLDKLNKMHDLLLNPQQDHVITGHLARVHATGRRSQVLDVGTGIGTWAINLARRHPYADVVGIDIDWSVFKRAYLPHGNIDFYTVDVTRHLPWSENTFDIIHIKSMLMDVPQYSVMVRKLARILRPGGLMILVESELTYQCLDGDGDETLADFAMSLKNAFTARGTDIDIARNLDKPVADTGLFSAQFYFQEIGCPVGPYVIGKSIIIQDAGRIHRAIVHDSLTALVCPRIPPGPERTHLENLIEMCTHVLCSPSSRYLQRLFAVYAYKKVPRQRQLRYST